MHVTQRVLLRAGLCACSLLAQSNVAWAQFGAAIQGTVRDTSKAVVPLAKVVLTNNETHRKQETDASGEGFYRFSGLAPGSYRVEASASGMMTQVVPNVQLTAEATQGVNITLAAGAVTETVTVTSEMASTLQTETANVSTELSEQAIRTLPQIGRDPYELVRLAPGVFGDAAPGPARGGAVALPNASRSGRLEQLHLSNRKPDSDGRQRAAYFPEQLRDRRRQRQQPDMGRRGRGHAQSGIRQVDPRVFERLLGRGRTKLGRADSKWSRRTEPTSSTAAASSSTTIRSFNAL